jgi:uncharacterized protein YcaQ
LLDAYAYKKRRLFEYWAHEASLIPVEHFPLFRHRMASARRWRIEEWADERREYVDSVLEQIQARGPLAVSGLDKPGERAGSWWGWGDGKIALEYLFNRGLITTRARPAFTRVYDLTERVIPRRYLEVPAPPAHEAHRELLLMAARSLGIGTAGDIADYYRLGITESRKILAGLVSAGELQEVEVKGWRGTAYLHPEARTPRRINARALLSPFDSLIWATVPSGRARPRDRTERLFGFRYVLEIYTPPPKRVYGYYVLPFLLGEELVGRVDLKADRAAGKLLARAAYAEEGVDHPAVATALSEELASLAAWLGLDDVVVEPKGDLAPALQRAFG